LTVDRLRNQLSALRNRQKGPLAENVAIKSRLQAWLDTLPNEIKKVVENSTIWLGSMANIDACLALYSSGDVLLSELEDEVKVGWKQLRKGTTRDRKVFLERLYKKFTEVIVAQNKVREPLEQEFLEAKATLEQLTKEVSGG
jgi:hypothetical protein